MRINRDFLLRIARETVQKRVFSDPSLVAAYLTGSLRNDNPFLGGATDIDIVFVHPKNPKIKRELVAVTPEVHLDIIHAPQSQFEKPRELRLHPWMGPELYDPLPLHVSGHFFEYVQAGVRDKFNDPESISTRARTIADHARQLWRSLQPGQDTGPNLLLSYLKCIQLAANAVALLGNGKPLAERRFLLQFPQYATANDRADLVEDLLELLGLVNLSAESLEHCLTAWEKDFTLSAGRQNPDVRIASPRLGYYKLAWESMLTGESPQTIMWPLLLTWTLAASALSKSQRGTWESTCLGLGLLGSGFEAKIGKLDIFLEKIEEMLENWSE